MKNNISGIYGISPANAPLSWLLARLEEAFISGLRVLQLRDKSPTQALQRAIAVRKLCQQYNVYLIINDDMQLAMDCGADGVHLGRSDINVAIDFSALSLLVGVSCQGDANYAKNMLNKGADYISLGAVFPTKTKLEAVAIGLKKTQQLCQHIHAQYPQACIVAIGGLGIQEIKQLRHVGNINKYNNIQAVAVSSALWQGNVTENMGLLQRAWRSNAA
ncbi:MAG: thiamine phosphate synthase [Mariprofundales bacterium]